MKSYHQVRFATTTRRLRRTTSQEDSTINPFFIVGTLAFATFFTALMVSWWVARRYRALFAVSHGSRPGISDLYAGDGDRDPEVETWRYRSVLAQRVAFVALIPWAVVLLAPVIWPSP